MPPLEALAAAMVTALAESDLAPSFVAEWSYDTTNEVDKLKVDDPIEIRLLVKAEETNVLNRVLLGTEMEIEVVVRKKIADTDRATVLALREFCETVFYFWAPPNERRIASVNKVWLTTVVDLPFSPDDLRTNHLFLAIATLTFGITR